MEEEMNNKDSVVIDAPEGLPFYLVKARHS
jgi:hypothetical protein